MPSFSRDLVTYTTYMIVVCKICGSWYNMDLREAIYCHDEENQWWIGDLRIPDDDWVDWCVYIAPGITDY